MSTETVSEQERRPAAGRSGLSRRRFLAAVGALGAVGATGYLARRALAPRVPAADPRRPPSAHRIEDFAANIRSGGPPKDGIPPIDRPRFVAAPEARFLSDDDVVFGLE